MMMMSSEEETDCVVMQERLLKKSKRTRQRVDAGEPRNSYASIPNFSSRPNSSGVPQPPPPSLLQLAASPSSSASMIHHSHLLQQQQQQQQHSLVNNNGYNFLGSPVHGVSGVCSSSPPFVSCPGNTVVGSGASSSSEIKGGLLVVQAEQSPNSSSSSSSGHQRLCHHHHHHHHRHHGHSRHHRSVSFDMGSDGEGKPSRDGELRLNGTPMKEGEVAPHHHPHSHLHQSSTSDDNSLLLREILQGGKQAADGGAVSPSSSPACNLLPNGKGSSSESIICHLLKNASSAGQTMQPNNNKDANNSGTKDENEEEIEDEDEDNDDEVEGVKQAGTVLRGSTQESAVATEETDCGHKPDISKEHLQQQQQQQLLDDDDDDEDEEGEEGALSKTRILCNRRLCSSTMNQSGESASASAEEEKEKERASVVAAVAAAAAAEEDEEEEEEEDDDDDEEIEDDCRPLSPDSSLRFKLKDNSSNIKLNATSAAALSLASSSSSSVELKRARVENIISSMRSSPSRPTTVEVPQVNGCKKRKLYMPQQHEAIRMANALAAAAALSPPPRDLLLCMDDELLGPVPCKQRRAEQDLLRQQLTQMQAQIAAIQHKLDVYEGPSSDSDVVGSSQSDDGQPDVMPVHNDPRSGSPRAGGGHRAGGTPPLLFHLGFGAGRDERAGPGKGGSSTTSCKPSTPDLEPAHFIDEARRLVSEQERLTKEVDTCKMMMAASSVSSSVAAATAPAEPKVAATAAAAAAAVAAAAGPVPRPPSAVIPPDWETLADILKLGMSSLIDDWVRRCAAKPTSCLPSVAELGSSSSSSSALIKEHVQSASLPPFTSATSSSFSAPLSAAASVASSLAATSVVNSSLHLQSDRRSPRTKVIDRGRMGAMGGGGGGTTSIGASSLAHLPPPSAPSMAALFTSSTNFGELHLKPPHVSAAMFPPPKPPMSLYVPHPSPHQSLAFYGQTASHGGGGESPEQSEALPLVVTPKKKRHKVTDTRITPRTVSRLLGQQEHLGNGGDGPKYSLIGGGASPIEGGGYHHHPPPIVPVSLPTSVAIPNPSLHQSDVFSPYPYYHHGSHHPRGSPHSDSMMDEAALLHPSHPAAHHHHAAAVALHSSLFMGAGHAPSPETLQQLTQQLKAENGGDSSDCNSGTDLLYDGNLPTISFSKTVSLHASLDSLPVQSLTPVHSSTLTPMHLRKAKLMFFYVRYPSSAILKTYFPDIKFNKNNTAQLVKWFSNFREFFYIQMEKYARQALSEGCKGADELSVTLDSELYRVLNLHYNRNNHIEVPVNFRYVVEQTLREFFKSIVAGKDQEQSWKKSIYKVIARMDDNVPDYFKSPNFLEQLE